MRCNFLARSGLGWSGPEPVWTKQIDESRIERLPLRRCGKLADTSIVECMYFVPLDMGDSQMRQGSGTAPVPSYSSNRAEIKRATRECRGTRVEGE
jgi:hypothetical protein